MAHHHIIGQSGTGKSTLAKEWLLAAVHDGHAVCYIDPHGHDTDELLHYIPARRRKDVMVFDPAHYAIPWNPLDTDNPPLTASVFADSIKAAWQYDRTPTPRMDGVLYNALVALMEAHEGLFGLYLILSSSQYRRHVLEAIKDPVVKRYWQWFDSLNEKQQLEQSDSTLNKVQALMADSRIRAIAGRKSGFRIDDYVKDKVLFIRLSQGEIGVQKAALIGSLLLVQIHQACLRRDTALPFQLFIDEVHTFAPYTIAEMLSGIRKYNVQLTTVHQYLAQLHPLLLASVKANSTQYVFRLSFEDSRSFPELGDQELQPYELEPYQAWVFGHHKPQLVTTAPLSFQQYEASARQIDANLRRNYCASFLGDAAKQLQQFS